MLGAYFGVSLIAAGTGFWIAALGAGLGVALFGAIIERFVLRRLVGAELAQVLVTLGLSFMVADVCLMQWGGDPISVETPAALRGATLLFGLAFPTYRLAIILIATVIAAALWAAAGPHAARRHDPRRGGRSGDGARRRHPRVASVHHRVLARRRAGGVRRRDRRADPVGLSRARSGHAAARAGGGDPGRLRQSAGLAGRQLRRRLPVQFRPGDVPRTGLRRPVPADAHRAGDPAAGAVRPGHRYEAPGARHRAGRAGDAAVLDRQQLLHQHRHPDADLRDPGARVERAGGICRPGHARPCRAVRHRSLCRRGPDQRRPRPRRRCSRRAAGNACGDGDVRGAGAARHRAWVRHDHRRARPDRLGHRVSLDQSDQRRQRRVDRRAARAVRAVADRGPGVLLGVLRRVPGHDRRHGDLRCLAVRRGGARHARPAAAHDRTRLQCLADALRSPSCSPASGAASRGCCISTTTSSSARRRWHSAHRPRRC